MHIEEYKLWFYILAYLQLADAFFKHKSMRSGSLKCSLWKTLEEKITLTTFAEELMLLNCGVGEDSWESLGLQGDPTSPFWRRSALGFLWKNDAKAETPVLWPAHAKSWLIGKDSDAGRDWEQEENGDDRGWDGWMASLSQWTWVWVNSGSWWWTGRPGVLWFMGSQRVGHDWVTELNWTELNPGKTTNVPNSSRMNTWATLPGKEPQSIEVLLEGKSYPE